MKTRTLIPLLAAAAAAFVPPLVTTLSAKEAKPVRQPVVQLALLLDTSNSMDGLIDQARSRLWEVVNDLATARHTGMRPRLQVALFEYGNSGLTAESHYIREVSGFTDDLDTISEKLFGLRTNGGSEYCGAVISRAITNLTWSEHHHDLKLLFIAGNEPFDQGPVDFRGAVRAAIQRGVTVNTIFCGPEAEGVATFWKDGAALADGSFACIDQNQREPHIDAPQDRDIAALNESLNATYLAYGDQGRARREMQLRQDANAAAAAPSSAIERVQAKASAMYNNSSWDLVDAVKAGEVEVSELDEAALPEPLRGLSAEEREARVAEMTAERARIQADIQRLARERETYIAAERAKLATGSAALSLDHAIRNSVRAQAEKLNYEFGE